MCSWTLFTGLITKMHKFFKHFTLQFIYLGLFLPFETILGDIILYFPWKITFIHSLCSGPIFTGDGPHIYIRIRGNFWQHKKYRFKRRSSLTLISCKKPSANFFAVVSRNPIETYEGCSISSWPNIEGITVAPIFYYYI